jgi:hypothetical protein
MVCIGIQAALLVVPSLLYVVYVQVWHRDQVLWELWMPIAFVCSCALSGDRCFRQLRRRGLCEYYRTSVAPIAEKLLAYGGPALGALSLTLGAAHYSRLTGIPLPDIALAAWIIGLAFVVPLDAAALIDERPVSVILSAFVPWAFCVAYPAYMFLRRGTKRWYGYLAIMSIALTLVGLVLSGDVQS